VTASTTCTKCAPWTGMDIVLCGEAWLQPEMLARESDVEDSRRYARETAGN